MQDIAGVEDNDYTRAVGKKVLIGAVARAFKPGCKLDTMLILEGEQGLRKSTLVRILGGKYTSEGIPAIGTKDAQQHLASFWFVEIAELDAFRKAELTKLKEFMSTTEDSYRPPYGRQTKKVPRKTIFIGTTNEFDYLNDPSGARRFWPVKCTKMIDSDKLVEIRDQLFAEAVHWYKGEEPWWLTPEEEELRKDQTETRQSQDPWQDKIEGYLLDKRETETTAVDILIDCLGFEAKDTHQAHKNRVGRVLRTLGWTSGKKRVQGTIKSVWLAPHQEPPSSNGDVTIAQFGR